MLLLVFAIICLFFLVLGSLVFVVCGTTPKLRRFALSAALWFAVWGPCVTVWMLFAGMIAFTADYSSQHMDLAGLHLPAWKSGFGLGLFWLAVVSTAAVATAVAWVHQVVVRRMTFALFRIYAAVVSAGVGSVWGWALGIWIATLGIRFGWLIWLAAMGMLIAAFGYEGYRLARKLRGEAPERFAWVSREEFEGSV